MREMDKYRCHKEVHAFKILSVETTVEGGILYHDGGGFHVPPAYMAKHKPEAGGYYVKYEDGYASFSPAEAFEKGYTLITAQDI